MKRLNGELFKQLASQTAAGTAIGTALGVVSSMLYWAAMALLETPHDPPILSIWSGVVCGCFHAGGPAVYGGLVGATVASLYFLWTNGVFAKALLVTFYALVWTAIILLSWLLRYQNSQNQAAIHARFIELCKDSQYNHTRAYDLMSPEYRQTHTLDAFRQDELFQGRLSEYRSSHGCHLYPESSITVRGNAAVLAPIPRGPLELDVGPIFELQRVDGKWYFTGETSWAYD